MHTMDNGTLVQKLISTQRRVAELEDAISEYKELREEVENSHDDAFGHQPKTVQRRMHKMNESKKELFEMVEDSG